MGSVKAEDPVSSYDDPPPPGQYSKEEKRWMWRSFVAIIGVLFVLNLMLCWGHFKIQQRAGFDNFERSRWARGNDVSLFSRRGWLSKPTNGWPAWPPAGEQWPKPMHRAFYAGVGNTGASGLVYAVAYGPGHNRYSMEVFRVGLPFATIEARMRRHTQGGVVILAEPGIGQKASAHWRVEGVLFNPLLISVPFWIVGGFIGPTMNKWDRGIKHRAWAKRWMCTGCGYDVQELPICPECGLKNIPRGSRDKPENLDRGS